MPIEFFKEELETPNLEFVGDYLKDNPKSDGKLYDVDSIKKAKSGKGYMLYTSHFICWFFKKEAIMSQIIEALDYYCQVGSGYILVIQLDKKAKKGFHIGIDQDRETVYVPLENQSYLSLHTSSMEVIQKENKDSTNPFLKKKPLPLPPHPLETVNNGEPELGNPMKGRKGVQG